MFLNFDHYLFLLSNKMLAIRVGIYKMLVRIANSEDPDETASSDTADLGLHCCLDIFGRQLVMEILEHLLGSKEYYQSGSPFNMSRFFFRKYIQDSHRLEKYLNIQVCLKKSLKNTQRPWNSLNFTIYRCGFNTVFGDLNQYKTVVPLFGAAYAAPKKKAPQFYTYFLKLISLVMQSSISEVEF